MMILSSPSGAGKTTLTKLLEKKFSNFTISISHTTRKPRPNETDGKDYFFVNETFVEQLDDAEIHPDIMGSDHCPVSLTLKRDSL